MLVGDEVWSFDLKTGSVAKGKISKIWVHKAAEYCVLHLTNGITIGMTPNHEVYVPRWGQFGPISLLAQDSELSFLPNIGDKQGVDLRNVRIQSFEPVLSNRLISELV